MKNVYLIETHAIQNAPICRFLPRDIVVKLYPQSNIQRLKYIFKYKVPLELPELEAIELMTRIPSLILVDKDGRATQKEADYERLVEYELTGTEKRVELVSILNHLLLAPVYQSTNDAIIDQINGQLTIGKTPLTEAGFKEYENDKRIEHEKEIEETRLQQIEAGKARVKEEEAHVNIS